MLTGCPYTEGCDTGSDPSAMEGGTTVDTGPRGPTKPNCEGLEAKCNDESCCTASNIPGGTFLRLNGVLATEDGVDAGGADNLKATISDFRLDVYEVTVGRFRAFINAGKGTTKSPPAEGSGKTNDPDDDGWKKEWNKLFLETKSELETTLASCDDAKIYLVYDPTPGKNDTLPMNCETWVEAQAFCIWDGGRLPTEAEWNYAAAGGDEQRLFPFKETTIDEDLVSFGCQSGSSQPMTNADGSKIRECTLKDWKPAGSHPKGRGKWGQQDMAGSAWERTFDWFQDIPPTPCKDCANPTAPKGDNPGRVFRGGAVNWGKDFQRTQDRSFINSEEMTVRTNTVGFRCARPTK